MRKMSPEELRALAKDSKIVASNYDELVAALGEEHSAQRELFRAVVSAARPALKAIGSRVRTGYRVWHLGDPHNQGEDQTWLEERGLYLGDEVAGPKKSNPRGSSGDYGGTDYFLLEDGSLLAVDYTGTWSTVIGSSGEWFARVERIEPDDFPPKQVECAIAAIKTAVESQLNGRAKEVTKTARARAEKLRAVAALIK